MSPNDDNELLKALRKANKAERKLQELVEEKCPGPHRIVQRRDMLPPWCSACGRTRRGIRLQTPRVNIPASG